MWPHIIIVSILKSKCTNIKGKGIKKKNHEKKEIKLDWLLGQVQATTLGYLK
jgi:hypothetical protein